MINNSFSFMKEGFDWQQAQSKDMQELDYKDNSHGIVGQWQDYEDRHDSDEEELKREQEIMRNDDLRDEYRERGLDPRDFYSEVD
jgi:hypothetical protein